VNLGYKGEEIAGVFFWGGWGFSGKTQINNIECENTREKGKNKQYAF